MRLLSVEDLALLRPLGMLSVDVWIGTDWFEHWLDVFKGGQGNWLNEADRLEFFKSHRKKREVKLPVHGEGKGAPTAFHYSFQWTAVRLGTVGQASDAQLYILRSAEKERDGKRQDARAKVAGDVLRVNTWILIEFKRHGLIRSAISLPPYGEAHRTGNHPSSLICYEEWQAAIGKAIWSFVHPRPVPGGWLDLPAGPDAFHLICGHFHKEWRLA